MQQESNRDANVGFTNTTLLVLERLASQVGIAIDRTRARRTLIDLLDANQAGSSPKRIVPGDLLANIGEQLEVRVDSMFLTIQEARKTIREGCPLATYVSNSDGSGEWLIVSKAGTWKLRVWSPRHGERWLTPSAFREAVGQVAKEEPLGWFSVQPASRFQVANVPKDHHDDAEHDHHHISPLRRLYQLLKTERGDIGIVTLFSLVVGLLALASPVAVESLVNTAAFGRFVQPLVVICIMLLTFLGFASAIKVLQAYIAELIQRRLFVRVVADLSYRLPRVKQTALDREHGPELLNRFFDVMTVQKSAALLVLDGIAIVMQTLIGMIVLAFYHPILLGFDLFLLASLGFAILVLGRGAVATAIAESKAKYSVAAWLEDLARIPLTFKASDGPRRAIEQADRLSSKYLAARRQHFRVLLRQIVFTLGLQAVSGSLLLGVGGWLVLQGQLTLGQLVAAEMIVAMIIGSFTKLGKHMESFYDLLAAVDKVGHLLDLPMERNAGEFTVRTDAGADVVIHNLSLRTPSGKGGLAGLNLRVHPGEIVALVGPPGAGKSLLLDVMYGLREPEHGYVSLDNIDVRSLQPANLRREVTLVRGFEIVSGTLAENVHMDRDGIGGTAVRHALREVGLLDEVLAMPNGCDTSMQPSGAPLSLSQIQRLMVARAIAKPPRLLLIDGLLDGFADELLPRVMSAIRRASTNCTVIIVTGRDDVWEFCDRRVTLTPPTGDDSPDSNSPLPTITSLAG